tara:strand:- start:7284 stop:8147 length:864 start_codon:yes stop_codon:yes gene_type:complete
LKSRYYIEGLIAVFLFGITPIFIKEVSANAVTIGLVRLVIGASFLFFIAGNKNLKKLTKKDWKALVLIGIVFGAHWITYFMSVKLATPSMAILSVSSFGLHMIYLNWIINKKKPSVYDIIAVLIALFGIYLIVPAFDLSNNLTTGILVGLVSAAFFAILPFIQQRNQHLDSMTRAFGQYSFALIVFLPMSFESNWDLTQQDWVYLIILGTVCTVGAHTLWLRASTVLPPTNTSLIFYLGTPIAMITSFIFLDEAMPTQKIVGAGLIISANVFAVFISRMKRRKSLKA